MCEAKRYPLNKTDESVAADSQKPHQAVLLKFWEIENFFKCPVVGMCLTASEQRQLLKKAGISIKDKNPFEIHETLVASSDDENQLSRKVDHLLRRKYGAEAVSMLSFEQKKFMVHWRKAFEGGDCRGALWATAASPDLPMECRREIFGAVHMTMHWTADQSVKLKQKMARQQQRFDEMQKDVKNAAADSRRLRKENNRLRRQETSLTARLESIAIEKAKLKETLAGLENRQRLKALEQENQELQEKLAILSESLGVEKRAVASLQDENMRLSAELEHQRELTGRFRKETREAIDGVFTVNHCGEACPSFDLCKKRILIVGGLTRMESLYRELIESSGGIFEYHDGYMKKGVRSLESRLRRADVVLCPVNCNSHGACSVVKNLAKKHNKTVHMLANSSLSTVIRVIQGAANDPAVIN